MFTIAHNSLSLDLIRQCDKSKKYLSNKINRVAVFQQHHLPVRLTSKIESNQREKNPHKHIDRSENCDDLIVFCLIEVVKHLIISVVFFYIELQNRGWEFLFRLLLTTEMFSVEYFAINVECNVFSKIIIKNNCIVFIEAHPSLVRNRVSVRFFSSNIFP